MLIDIGFTVTGGSKDNGGVNGQESEKLDEVELERLETLASSGLTERDSTGELKAFLENVEKVLRGSLWETLPMRLELIELVAFMMLFVLFVSLALETLFKRVNVLEFRAALFSVTALVTREMSVPLLSFPITGFLILMGVCFNFKELLRPILMELRVCK